jgi:hypothetical protein
MTRFCARGALLTAALGAVGLAAAGSGGSGLAGYVSEAGADGQPHAVLYRASVFGLALALGLLALAMRAVAWLAVLPLAGASPCVAVSAAVRCTPGCPLPPHNRSTARDLVHAGASIAGVGLCAVAMLVVAVCVAEPVLRRVSLLGASVAVPVSAAAGVAILAVGRGALTGVLERLALSACVLWVLSVAVVLGRPARPPR